MSNDLATDLSGRLIYWLCVIEQYHFCSLGGHSEAALKEIFVQMVATCPILLLPCLGACFAMIGNGATIRRQ
jgi:hypothetical protein